MPRQWTSPDAGLAAGLPHHPERPSPANTPPAQAPDIAPPPNEQPPLEEPPAPGVPGELPPGQPPPVRRRRSKSRRCHVPGPHPRQPSEPALASFRPLAELRSATNAGKAIAAAW